MQLARQWFILLSTPKRLADPTRVSYGNRLARCPTEGVGRFSAYWEGRSPRRHRGLSAARLPLLTAQTALPTHTAGWAAVVSAGYCRRASGK
eukprot:scaffold93001_cov92-Phaeocystis_antarctica.AAC.1